MSVYPRERSRSSGGDIISQGSYERMDAVGGTVCGLSHTSDIVTSYKSDYTYEYIGDCEVPEWKSKIARGVIVNNPFERRKISIEYHPVGSWSHWMRKSTTLSCSPSGSVYKQLLLQGSFGPPNQDFLVSDFSSTCQGVIDTAVTQAHANIDPSAMLALATAAEGRKTVDSVAAISRRAYKVLRAVRRLDLRALRRELKPKELADRYMELRYALRPIIYDMVGVMKVLSEERRHVRQTYLGYSSSTATSSDTLADRTFSGYYAIADWQRKCDYICSARAGVLCDVNINTVNVLGVTQPIETLWEICPWSFVADWIANIGDTISAWTPNAGVTQLASWVTVKEEFTSTNTIVNVRSTSSSAGYVQSTISANTSPSVRKESVLRRIVDPQLSAFPRVNINLDAYKLLDLGIMIRGLFR